MPGSACAHDADAAPRQAHRARGRPKTLVMPTRRAADPRYRAATRVRVGGGVDGESGGDAPRRRRPDHIPHGWSEAQTAPVMKLATELQDLIAPKPRECQVRVTRSERERTGSGGGASNLSARRRETAEEPHGISRRIRAGHDESRRGELVGEQRERENLQPRTWRSRATTNQSRRSRFETAGRASACRLKLARRGD